MTYEKKISHNCCKLQAIKKVNLRIEKLIKMKHFSILMFVLLSTALFSQKASYNIDKAVNDITKLYNLSDSQKAQYKEIVTAKYKSFTKVRANNNDREANQEAIDEASKKYDDSFLAILDERQKEIFHIQKKMATGIKADRQAQSANDLLQRDQIKPKRQ